MHLLAFLGTVSVVMQRSLPSPASLGHSSRCGGFKGLATPTTTSLWKISAKYSTWITRRQSDHNLMGKYSLPVTSDRCERTISKIFRRNAPSLCFT